MKEPRWIEPDCGRYGYWSNGDNIAIVADGRPDKVWVPGAGPPQPYEIMTNRREKLPAETTYEEAKAVALALLRLEA